VTEPLAITLILTSLIISTPSKKCRNVILYLFCDTNYWR
jgi:hypothetical protein